LNRNRKKRIFFFHQTDYFTHMANAQETHPSYQTMAVALNYLADNHDNQPTLKELATLSGLSEFHFQKLFTRWVGISPKRFSQFLSKEYIKSLLDAGMKPMDACYQAGLSGPGRIHELFIHTEAISPAQYKALGKGITIHYGIHDSPFGKYLLGLTDKGICHLEFITTGMEESLNSLHANWPGSNLIQNDQITKTVHEKLFDSVTGKKEAISLLLKGTNFQIQVWQALLKIPYGRISTYEELASLAGNQSATRASASAIARNNIAWLIPCHRVVKKIGESGQYRWGADRKKIILAYEGATSQKDDSSPVSSTS
jgi:AraC family transcriptional regulator, regulatory protein of adaptative response / methylated-DNA-[protein]-cysteine methyltransferase